MKKHHQKFPSTKSIQPGSTVRVRYDTDKSWLKKGVVLDKRTMRTIFLKYVHYLFIIHCKLCNLTNKNRIKMITYNKNLTSAQFFEQGKLRTLRKSCILKNFKPNKKKLEPHY